MLDPCATTRGAPCLTREIFATCEEGFPTRLSQAYLPTISGREDESAKSILEILQNLKYLHFANFSFLMLHRKVLLPTGSQAP